LGSTGLDAQLAGRRIVSLVFISGLFGGRKISIMFHAAVPDAGD
jgi:hypothetical protein